MSVKTISVRKIKNLNFIETGLPEISFLHLILFD